MQKIKSDSKTKSKQNKLIVMAWWDACKHLWISRQRFEYLVEAYEIPFQKTSAGKIFFKEDLDKFQEDRSRKMKHGKN